MKRLFTLITGLFVFQFSMAQMETADSLQRAKKDSIKMAKIEATLVYPLLKTGGKWSGVIPVTNPNEIPDPSINYKLLFELAINNKDTAAKTINNGLTEICRIINLHAASGIPVKNITPVIVMHGPALFSFYTNENYKKKYKTDNPNIAVVEELVNKTGARFIACGQAMAFEEVLRDEMLPQVKVSLTAKTVLSHYQLKGYMLYKIEEEK